MVQSYEIKSSDSRKGSGFVDSFKALFRRNRQPESLKVPSKRSGKAPIADPEPSEPSSLVSNASSSEENNNIGGIRSSANAPESSTTTTVSVPVDANRYEIRKPPPAVKRKSSYSTTTTKSSKSGGKPVQRRKSFGRRINNLWSNFGLLRSSEKIVEFANGYGEYHYHYITALFHFGSSKLPCGLCAELSQCAMLPGLNEQPKETHCLFCLHHCQPAKTSGQ